MVEWMNEMAGWYIDLSAWEIFWLGVGFTGQVIFGMRFIIQWIVSEKEKRCVIPRSFWYLSIVGSLILFIYATYRLDPVFMLGTGANSLIYIRNITLLKREDEQVKG